MKSRKCMGCHKKFKISRKNVERYGPYYLFYRQEYDYFTVCLYCKKRERIKFRELPLNVMLHYILKK